MRITSLIILMMLGLGQAPAFADEIRVAVASNFSSTLGLLADSFEKKTGNRVLLSTGSTGKHYAQIRNGAPFDAFFAADVRRPELLEQEGLIVPGSRFTYAIGRLVLWSPREGYVDDEGKVLEQGTFHHLAIANPRLAPYGLAARQVLEQRALWQVLKAKMVRGENIGQAFGFVQSGNAELGFVALSQIQGPGQIMKGSAWLVPQSLHAPVEQQAVLLRDNQAASDFLDFVRSEESRKVILEFGYGIPDA